MKNIFASVALFMLLAAPAFAQTGGYTGPGADGRTVSVTDLRNLDDDTMVRLIGSIETKISDEKYRFRDNTGTVMIDIEDEMWRKITVSPEDRVEIYGELDKGLIADPQIEVKQITRMN